MRDQEPNTNGTHESIVQFFRDQPAALRDVSLAMSAPYNSKDAKMRGLYAACTQLAQIYAVSVHIDENIQAIMLYDAERTYTGGLVGKRSAPSSDCSWCAQIAGTFWTECSQDVVDATRERIADVVARDREGTPQRLAS